MENTGIIDFFSPAKHSFLNKKQAGSCAFLLPMYMCLICSSTEQMEIFFNYICFS